jgi:hypothetical protein
MIPAGADSKKVKKNRKTWQVSDTLFDRGIFVMQVVRSLRCAKMGKNPGKVGESLERALGKI